MNVVASYPGYSLLPIDSRDRLHFFILMYFILVHLYSLGFYDTLMLRMVESLSRCSLAEDSLSWSTVSFSAET